ncbi:STE3-like pheromone receptor [Artomyces pyxidatus]|uniref:STE3-like pheromone receptor n=1 Tax=Artomyces pyxidatus TaxID=48021 RepID=A0ACB8T313_9AGAM|nr:STE3-like pheromone receptor [Artomyces pyxidatus]
MPEPLNVVLSTFSCLGFILSLIPLYQHLEAGNAGTCLYMFWAAVSCLHQFINALIWTDDVDVAYSAPTWCAVSTHITLAEKVAMQAAALCIARRMYAIANKTFSSKRREETIDYSIGFGIPALQIGLYVAAFNGSRTMILEGTGCWPVVADNSTTYLLASVCPIVTILLTTFYGARALLSIRRRRNAMDISQKGLKLDNNLYFRMAILVGVIIFVSAPLCVYGLYLNGKSNSLHSWSHQRSRHSDLGAAAHQVSSAIWKANMRLRVAVELWQWINIIVSFLFFALFGFSHDAIKHYRFLVYAALDDFEDWDGQMNEDDLDDSEQLEERQT